MMGRGWRILVFFFVFFEELEFLSFFKVKREEV